MNKLYRAYLYIRRNANQAFKTLFSFFWNLKTEDSFSLNSYDADVAGVNLSEGSYMTPHITTCDSDRLYADIDVDSDAVHLGNLNLQEYLPSDLNYTIDASVDADLTPQVQVSTTLDINYKLSPEFDYTSNISFKDYVATFLQSGINTHTDFTANLTILEHPVDLIYYYIDIPTKDKLPVENYYGDILKLLTWANNFNFGATSTTAYADVIKLLN